MQLEEVIRKIISTLIANPHLALALFILFIAALYLIYRLVHKPRIMRYMGAEPVALDHSKLRPVTKPITSWVEGFLLTGKPDQIYELDDGSVIPVEYKSSNPKRAPYYSHILQATSYSMLLESQGKHSPYSVLCYPAGTPIKISNTPGRREEVVRHMKIIRDLREGEKINYVPEPWKCRHCNVVNCKYRRR